MNDWPVVMYDKLFLNKIRLSIISMNAFTTSSKLNKENHHKKFVNPFKSMGKLVSEYYISPKRFKKNTKLYYYDFVCKR